jgi:hypothetical protein
MKRSATVFVLAGSLSLVVSQLCAPAAAQSKAPREADARGESERAGKEGERLLAQHDAAGAISELGKAYNLSHNPRFLLPLGLAYAEAERPLDALDALGRFLKDAPAVPDAKRKEIGAKFAVMLDQVAALVTLDASRQNAQVKIDGRPVGVTPIDTPLRLMPGKHEIVMMPAPTDPSSGARVLLEVRPGERRSVKLEPGARSRFLEPQSQNQPAGGDDSPGEPALRTEGSSKPIAAATPAAAPSASTGSEFHARDLVKKWWFWTGIGAVAVLGVGLGVGLGTRNHSTTSEEFPNVASWPGGPINARPAALLSVSGFSL